LVSMVIASLDGRVWGHVCPLSVLVLVRDLVDAWTAFFEKDESLGRVSRFGKRLEKGECPDAEVARIAKADCAHAEDSGAAKTECHYAEVSGAAKIECHYA